MEAIQLEATAGVGNLEDLTTALALDIEGSLTLPIHPGPSQERISGLQMPVLFMYGGIGWQLHLRITVEQTSDPDRKGRKLATFPRLAHVQHLDELLQIMEPAVGSSRITPISSACSGPSIRG
jgi:hypothetical protein